MDKGEARKMGEGDDEAGGMSQDPRAFSKRAARAAAAEGEANASIEANEANEANEAKEVAAGEGGGSRRGSSEWRCG